MAPTEPPGPELIFSAPRMELKCYQEPQQIYGTTQYPTEPKSPAEWFSQKFTEATLVNDNHSFPWRRL